MLPRLLVKFYNDYKTLWQSNQLKDAGYLFVPHVVKATTGDRAFCLKKNPIVVEQHSNANNTTGINQLLFDYLIITWPDQIQSINS